MYLRNFNVTPGDAIFDSSFPVEVCTERKRRDFYERDTICKGGKKDQKKIEKGIEEGGRKAQESIKKVHETNPGCSLFISLYLFLLLGNPAQFYSQ